MAEKEKTLSTPQAPDPTSNEAKLLEVIGRLEARIEQLESSRNPQFGSSAVPLSIGLPGAPQTAGERMLAKLHQKQAQQKHLADQADALLAEGAKRFRISIENEPRMTRIVGADSGEHEARGKYMAYFGILSTQNKVLIEPFEDVKLAEAPAIAAGTLSR